ncbi:hypothetical protein GXW74_03030 [Roseomonas eburnea]|uniref:Uncharacterized protein n=1 Tax=Neoroseomonas eburnea TaxID=1346889 RepID=A0A9X9X6W2_9PROT|nr:hypothetical protein [Neoroseomonas eburnea]MBR0679448.1 hypothetical protein [Neoroseomonas eburnea]
MLKSKSKSMQRGTYYNDEEKISKQEFYESTQQTLSKSEIDHFQFGDTKRVEFLNKMRPHIQQLSRIRIRKPAEVAKNLNRKRLFTACGQEWSPRLVAFLLSFLFSSDIDYAARGTRIRQKISASVSKITHSESRHNQVSGHDVARSKSINENSTPSRFNDKKRADIPPRRDRDYPIGFRELMDNIQKKK